MARNGKRKPRAAKQSIPKTLTLGNGVPPRMFLRSKYASTVDLNPGAAATVEQVCRANSLYDPDYTGVGHQATLNDQMALLYQKYTVLRSRMLVRFLDASSASAYIHPSLVVLGLIPDTTAPSTAIGFLELGSSKVWALTASRSDVGYPKDLVLDWDAKRDVGVTNPLDRDDLSASFGASPTNTPCYCISYGALNGEDCAPLCVVYEIEYDVVCHQPKLLTQS